MKRWELPVDLDSPLPDEPWPRRREIRRRRVYRLTRLAFEGWSTETIAEMEGVTPRRVRSIFAAAGVAMPHPPGMRRLPVVILPGARAARLDRLAREAGMTPGEAVSAIVKNALEGDGRLARRLLGKLAGRGGR